MGNVHHKIPKEEMEFLLKNTKFDKNTIKQWYDAFLIDCPDGQLSRDKLTKIYNDIYPHGNAEEFCVHTFRTFDTNHNGYIDFTEFCLAISIVSQGTPKEKLNWAFHMVDIDGNGTIEKEEVKTIVRATCSLMDSAKEDGRYDADARANEIFARLDLNKDGHLSKEEFINGCIADPSLSEMLAPTPEFLLQ